VFNAAISGDFTQIPQMSSSDYVKESWGKYKRYCSACPQDKSMNGLIFELIIKSELYRKSILPMFLQASVAFVPNVAFDILLYSSEHFPIGLSLKTSLRERYKQADLEAVALKYVHRRAQNCLITLDRAEADIAKRKAANGELLGINEVIIADSNDFDVLIERLSQMDFIRPEKIDIISASSIVTRA